MVPIAWLVWNRLWYAVAVYALFTLFVFTLGQTGWAASTAAISFLPGLYLFLEGRNLIAGKLRRSGWVLNDVFEAGNLAYEELKFFRRLEEASDP